MSFPLILDPRAGSRISELKEVCRKFDNLTNVRVVYRKGLEPQSGMKLKQSL